MGPTAGCVGLRGLLQDAFTAAASGNSGCCTPAWARGMVGVLLVVVWRVLSGCRTGDPLVWSIFICADLLCAFGEMSLSLPDIFGRIPCCRHKPFLGLCLTRTSFHPVVFHSLSVFSRAEVFNFDKVHFTNLFFLWVVFLVLYLEYLCLIQGHKVFSPMFSSRNLEF